MAGDNADAHVEAMAAVQAIFDRYYALAAARPNGNTVSTLCVQL